MKRNDGHSLESVAISVAVLAIVVCSLAAHGDSLSGGPLNVGASQASTQQSTQASTQSRAETELKTSTVGSDRSATNSGFADKRRSAGSARGLQTLINSPAIMGTKAPHRKTVARRSAKHKIAAKNRKARKNWKVVNYDWHSKTKSTSYVDMTKTH